ncbi:hypothetical protein LINPERPRIM_LOCUS15047, partial [Linum perenne]
SLLWPPVHIFIFNLIGPGQIHQFRRNHKEVLGETGLHTRTASFCLLVSPRRLCGFAETLGLVPGD